MMIGWETDGFYLILSLIFSILRMFTFIFHDRLNTPWHSCSAEGVVLFYLSL